MAGVMMLTHLPPAHALKGVPATPVAFIRAILAAYEKCGLSGQRALDLAQIAPPLLEDPANRVTAGQLEMMSAVAMQELDDEALGWFSRRLPWGSYGMLCRASITAPDLNVALQRWCRHHRLLTEDVLLGLSVRGAVAEIALEHRRALGDMREFCLLTCLRYVLGYACWAVDSRIELQEVSFPFPQPAHGDIYQRMFACPVRFDAGVASLSFDARYLALPLRRNEADLRQMLRRALPLTVHQYRRDRLLLERVRRLLREHPGWNVDEVAAQLHVSARTLHRRLQEEDATLVALKDEARRKLAAELLSQGRPVKQVARAAGFDNDKSFSRAFKSWTGQSPSAYRKGSAV